MGKISMTNDVPQTLQDLAPGLAALFGVEHWDIWVSMADQPGGQDLGGICKTQIRYYCAEIEIRRDASFQRQQESLVHEFLHIVLAPVAAIIGRSLDRMTERERLLMEGPAYDAEEQVVELLRRSLQAAGAFPIATEVPA